MQIKSVWYLGAKLKIRMPAGNPSNWNRIFISLLQFNFIFNRNISFRYACTLFFPNALLVLPPVYTCIQSVLSIVWKCTRCQFLGINTSTPDAASRARKYRAPTLTRIVYLKSNSWSGKDKGASSIVHFLFFAKIYFLINLRLHNIFITAWQSNRYSNKKRDEV